MVLIELFGSVQISVIGVIRGKVWVFVQSPLASTQLRPEISPEERQVSGRGFIRAVNASKCGPLAPGPKTHAVQKPEHNLFFDLEGFEHTSARNELGLIQTT
jgi:hypothetical protein